MCKALDLRMFLEAIGSMDKEVEPSKTSISGYVLVLDAVRFELITFFHYQCFYK